MQVAVCVSSSKFYNTKLGAFKASQPSLPVGKMGPTETERPTTPNTGGDVFGSRRVRTDVAEKLAKRYLELINGMYAHL